MIQYPMGINIHRKQMTHSWFFIVSVFRLYILLLLKVKPIVFMLFIHYKFFPHSTSTSAKPHSPTHVKTHKYGILSTQGK